MKKLLTIVASLVMLSSFAMADTYNVTGHQATEILSQSYGLTQAQLVTNVGTFYFTIDGASGFVADSTYTNASFDADYSFFDYMGQGSTYYTFTTGTYLVKTDSTHWTAVAVIDETGDIYNITIAPIEPIENPIDTVNITLNSKINNRVTDVTADQGIFQLVGYNDDYALYFAIYSDQVAGTYTEADLYTDYTALYLMEDASEIELNNLLGNVVVSQNDGTTTAHINWVGTDSVLYSMDFTYSDPVATTTATFTSSELSVSENEYYDIYSQYYGYYVYDFEAEDANGVTISGTIFNAETDEANGEWDLEDGYAEIYLTDADGVEYEGFSGAFTVTGNNAMTGTVLFYGDLQYTIAVGSTQSIENAQVVNFRTVAEGRSIVVKGVQNNMVEVYDMAGRKVSSMNATSNEVRFQAPTAGVYIVRVNGKAQRVVVQ